MHIGLILIQCCPDLTYVKVNFLSSEGQNRNPCAHFFGCNVLHLVHDWRRRYFMVYIIPAGWPDFLIVNWSSHALFCLPVVRSAGQLLVDKLEQYKRCCQCKRRTTNCGESHIWKDSHYLSGSQYMIWWTVQPTAALDHQNLTTVHQDLNPCNSSSCDGY